MATEKRLIYLDEAIAKIVDTPSVIAERVFNGDYGYEQNPDVLVDRQHEIIDLLEAVPTVDAMEVVHGRWEAKDSYFDWELQCSLCGEQYWIEKDELETHKPKYCPNCGADMRGNGNG